MSLNCTTFLYSYTQTYIDNVSQSIYVQKLAVLPFLNVKSQVFLNKSCTTLFCNRGYGLRENDSSILYTYAFHAGDLRGLTTTGLHLQIYHSHIP